MKSVFISYSAADSDKAMMIVDMLVREGFLVSSLVPGADWQANLLSAIRRCSVFLALVDQPTPNVMLELGYALGAAKQVLLVGGRDARIPFDVACLPVVRFDALERGALFEIADAVRSKASAEPPPTQLVRGRNHLLHMLENADYLDDVSPPEFESLVLDYLRELGFDAHQMPPAHDGGYDILVKHPEASLVAVVEVKKYTRGSKVGIAHVRQLVGAMSISNASCGIFITTSEFSASARGMAKSAPRPVLLLTLKELVNSTLESITTACS